MNALILMTRIPIPGKTKTRLMDILTGYECADLHMAFLRDLMVTFEQLKDIDIFVTYTPENSLHILEEIIPPYIDIFPQSDGDLGNKMYNAIKEVCSKGYEKVILIGSDIPDLNKVDIKTSFQILDSHDVVLGPTYDGGYYLVGMKTPNQILFDIKKKWSGKSVFESTVDKGNEHGMTIGLSPKYRDIDTKEDLFEFEIKYKDSVTSLTMGFIKEWRNCRWSETN